MARLPGAAVPVLREEATEAKSNEITVIPLLLQHLDHHGVLVTIDVIGAQTVIVQAILNGGGDYVLAPKES
jgi:predicted transposase YbfD/YdcC